jgi:hypothetical protein
VSEYAASNINIIPVPSLSTNPTNNDLPYITNAILAPATNDYTYLAPNHLNDWWQSADGTNEPLGTPQRIVGGVDTESVTPVTNTTLVGVDDTGLIHYYTHNLDVWLPPGSVDYLYHTNAAGVLVVSNNGVYVSDYTKPTKTINIYLNAGDQNVLVMPGYVADGLFFDQLDLPYPDNGTGGTYPRYRKDNYQFPFVWYDALSYDTANEGANPFLSPSIERQLMFRNYVNLLTGFTVGRADDPQQTPTVASGSYDGVSEFEGYEPLDATSPPYVRPINGLGPYYPGAGFYSPFDNMGIDSQPQYMLVDPSSDPDSGQTGLARHLSYSINMLSTNAAPEWSGEWFFEGTGGTGVISGTSNTSISTLMATKAEWENGAPAWLTADFDNSANIMTNEAAHNSALAVSVWRPVTFNGSNNLVSGGSGSFPPGSVLPTDSANYTGGYVTDGNGNFYSNAMGWSGRPTHYFDFSQGKWIAVADNHTPKIQALPLGIWKAQEYAWHARALGVTIYTVGYGSAVNDDEQVLLAQVANATNTTAGGGSNISYNPDQPIGEQFFALTTNDIYSDFYSVGQAINAALTQ